MLARWNRTGTVAPSDVIRARMAVPQVFSQKLDSVVQIILTKPVYAWKGIAHFQNDSARGVTYMVAASSSIFLTWPRIIAA